MAQLRSPDQVRKRPMLGVDRTCGADHQTDANDPISDFSTNDAVPTVGLCKGALELHYRRIQPRDRVLAFYGIGRSGGGMRRRKFIQAVVLSIALPPPARAQQSAPSSRIVKIGVLWQVDSADDLLRIYGDALTQSLSGLGYVDGKTAQLLNR